MSHPYEAPLIDSIVYLPVITYGMLLAAFSLRMLTLVKSLSLCSCLLSWLLAWHKPWFSSRPLHFSQNVWMTSTPEPESDSWVDLKIEEKSQDRNLVVGWFIGMIFRWCCGTWKHYWLFGASDYYWLHSMTNQCSATESTEEQSKFTRNWIPESNKAASWLHSVNTGPQVACHATAEKRNIDSSPLPQINCNLARQSNDIIIFRWINFWRKR